MTGRSGVFGRATEEEEEEEAEEEESLRRNVIAGVGFRVCLLWDDAMAKHHVEFYVKPNC